LFKQEMGMQKQSGFTLIELVVVIVILGILSAVALPKFIDLSSQANLAAAQGVAGALSSATSINYAAKKASAAGGVTVTTCTSALATLTGGALPTNFALNNGATACAVADGGTATCGLSSTAAPTQIASATIICVP
jgi:MSHA pilin protein MshA